MIKIKPLSVNDCWKGRRFKSEAYEAYEKELWYLLPKKILIPDGELKVFYEFGVSSKNSDWDNMIKPFQDILQKKYDFNDNRIYRAIVQKVIVKKGEEYIKFSLKKNEDT